MSTPSSTQSRQKLFDLALKTRTTSYSPYSKVQVGAAVQMENGDLFGGANIENASFGGTVCAERVAIWKALTSENPSQKIKEIIVVTQDSWSPCGFCRQVIAEFATPDTLVHIASLAEIKKSFTIKELLPEAFSSWLP